MKICLVGAGGGIGRQLLKTFSAGHEVSAVYRTLPQHLPSGIEAVRFEDEDGLAQAVHGAEVVVHAALNTSKRGQAFIAANRDVTERLLSLIRPDQCRLFVYFSSQVVYAALDPVQHPVQGEDAELADRPGLDYYTRLKLQEEERVIAACREKGIDYLIVRPTVVMGPNMQWSSGIVAAMRMAPFGLKGRTINLIHVEDLSKQLLALIERGVVNDVVNLGDLDVSSDDYFRYAASLAHRPMLFAPNWLTGAAGRAIPSTLWFFAHNVRVDSEKVRRLSGIATNRQLAEFFEPPARIVEARSLDDIRELVRSGTPYHAIGRGYFLWFNDKLTTHQLVMEHYAGIVRLDGDLLTVRAGTTLRAMLEHLTPLGMTLATLPEFVDISAGACFFAEVHGSSADYISVYDLITAIRYVDRDGEEKASQRDEHEWDRLREGNGIVVTEVTFRCRPNHRLANVIEWHPDSRLESYVEGGYLANLSTTVHWYPRSRELMVYNVNPLEGTHPKDRGPFAPMRGSPAAMQKLLLSLRLRGRLRIVGSSEQVLAPWTGVPAKHLVGKLFRDARRRVRNMEVCVPDTCAADFISRLRQKLPEMSLTPGQGVGVRFTRQPSTGRGFVWVEMTSRNIEQMHALIEMARAACGESFWLHRGKYVPRWIGTEHLFIPRSPGLAWTMPGEIETSARREPR
ncbi:NAD-dependent epimerase/dehydratase family protein [Devosia sp. YIM 151766]|uniref:NAD-dependent epimerase/dehydratase family protein n=1 Tax=Devosia sp. YIM 151766 TaxID=3017325 RepID=UPI00255CE1D0|nr:NAD-dependent epimerase/dehydratase family protein [Devosia sp. YIM 151766]WIY54047.1 NAD-dependent epimerase/dehydratase family protein [Devosia sp. YIM 151766]